MPKKILVLDGGGARGVIQINALVELEKSVGPLWEYFDLIVGSSIGAVIGGALAVGVPAYEIKREMNYTLPIIFKRRLGMFLRKKKYDKSELFNCASRMFGESLEMHFCKTKFVGTSINDMTGKVHFFKSWEHKDGSIRVVDVMDRSSAAPVYFGPVADRKTPAVWIDGGVGLNNNPSSFAMVECARLGWDVEGVHCINIGTGYVPHSRSYDDALNNGIFSQALNYMRDGGYAHRGAERIISRFVKSASLSACMWFDYRRYDVEIEEALHKMDGVEFIPEYRTKGLLLGIKIVEDWCA